jgi:hypothetical protein
MEKDLINRYNPLTRKWERVPKGTDYTPGAPALNTIPKPLRANSKDIGKESSFDVPAYKGGSARSVQTLNDLRFDPIVRLVENYRKLEQELAWHEQIRSGELIALLPSGKPRAYNADAHMRVYDKLLEVGKELLRYGYGRVPENMPSFGEKVPTMVVNLTTSDAEFKRVYEVVNDNAPSDSE